VLVEDWGIYWLLVAGCWLLVLATEH